MSAVKIFKHLLGTRQTRTSFLRLSSSIKCGEGSIIQSEFPPVDVQSEPFHLTLLNALKKHESLQPNRTALVNADIENDKVTYSEFLSHSLSIASFLESIGFSKGDVTGVVMPNCWQYLAIFFGSLMQGGCVSGASVALTDSEIARQINHSKCKVVFCPTNMAFRLLKLKENLPHLELVVSVSLGCPGEKNDALPFEKIISTRPQKQYQPNMNIDADKDLLLLPYSSGTTGLPKGVMLTHKNYGTMLRIFNHHLDNRILKKMDPNWDWKNESKSLVLPFHHSLSICISSLFLTMVSLVYGFALGLNILLAGGCGVILKRFEFDTFLRTIQDYKLKIAMIVPPIMVYLAKSSLVSKYDLSSLKFIMTGAAPAGKDLCDKIMEKLPSISQISQGYGMTEASMATHLPLFGFKNPSAVGKLISNMEMKRKPVKIGEKGEICVRGPIVMLGYLDNPKATLETIDEDGWLRTGDVGYVDSDGWTYIVDRIKELIKVKGFQVAPAELEGILLSHPKIRDCAVVGVPDRVCGELPKAFIVKCDEMLAAEEVHEFIKEQVASYKQLRGGIVFIDEIPKSPSGKILRRLLRDNPTTKN